MRTPTTYTASRSWHRGGAKLAAAVLIVVSALAGMVSPASAADGEQYKSLVPARVLDTRDGTGVAAAGTIGAGDTIDLAMLGEGGVPASGVNAVALNVTVTQPGKGGYITVYPTGATEPLTSSLNFTNGQTVGNMVIATLGTDGKVTLKNGSGGTVHIIADVTGYFPAAESTDFNGMVPERQLDTRIGVGAADAAVAAGGTVVLDVTKGGVPTTGVTAVVLNVTVTSPTRGGYITVYPSDAEERPVTSSLNYAANSTTGSLVIATVAADGTVSLYNGSSGTVEIIADVSGWFTTAVEGDDYEALVPERALDTRNATGVLTTTPVASKTSIQLNVTASANVPDDAAAVVLTLVSNQPTKGGFITVWPEGEEMPLASSLNFAAGETRANLVIAKVGAGGVLNLYNGSGGTVHLIADIAGYYPAAAPVT